jgi:hypothetical protein
MRLEHSQVDKLTREAAGNERGDEVALRACPRKEATSWWRTWTGRTCAGGRGAAPARRRRTATRRRVAGEDSMADAELDEDDAVVDEREKE